MWQTFFRKRKNIILASASGLALALAFPKTGFGWLAWISLAPLLLALRQSGAKGGFWTGFISGLIHHLVLLSWTVHTMHVYGYLPFYLCVGILVLFATCMALYWAIFGAAVAWGCDDPIHLMWFAPAAWVGLELLRTWLFTGFPWELLGYSQYKYTWLIQFADIFGVYGVSALIAGVNTALFLCILHWLKVPWKTHRLQGRVAAISGIVWLAVFVFACGYSMLRINTLDAAIDAAGRDSKTWKVSVIQGNIDQGEKWDSSFQKFTVEKYRKLSLDAAALKPDLLIWPEAATPFFLFDDLMFTQMVLENVKKTKIAYLIGTPSFEHKDSEYTYYNSAFLVSPQGKSLGRYDKVKLVPFGEYVPLKWLLPFVNKLISLEGEFSTGQRGDTLNLMQHKIGTLVCYETIFPNLARAMVKNGAHLLVNITNDAWFGQTSAAYQHFSMTIFRAIENRRPLARAANTGISGFIDPCGRVISNTDIFVDATDTAQLPLLEITTRYTQWGDWPIIVLSFGSIVLFAMITVAKTRRCAA
ncbi:MAG: apolipoprotein N-acyltransferase [Desulfobacteraceae bacterium]|nr:apolipoprotein N-acyltransferase [Desulfobacteraceae bacterium]